MPGPDFFTLPMPGMISKLTLGLIGLAALSSTALAGDKIKPGTYVTEGGWGSMTIKQEVGEPALKFSISTVGANAHTCEVEGEIQGNQSISEPVPERKCLIRFMPSRGKVSVIVPDEFNEACHDYCGMRAWFPGDYYPEVPYCRKVEDLRKKFKRYYQSGKYEQARMVLIDLLSHCERFLDWQTQAGIRNDLAITEFHLHDTNACLKALAPIKRVFIDDPADTGLVFTPVDEEWGCAMTKGTRFNWRKCGGKLPAYKHGTTYQQCSQQPPE